LVNQLTDFQAEYSKNQSELAGTNEQIVYLNTEIQKYPERIETDAKTVQNLALQTLKPEVLQLEAERAELLSRYLPDSKRIQSIEGLSNSLAQAKVQETTLQASQSELALQIKLFQQQLKVLADNSVEIQRLRQQVETDKEIYLSYSLKGEEARAAEALNLNRILNANIAQPPTTPVEPSFPSTTINLIAGFMFACAFAFGVVYVAEMRDPKVYSREMASQVSGVSTVAVITLFPNE
jgi:succinoglycan biosynthesis transport protein ExoP